MIEETDHAKEWGGQPTIPFSQHFISEGTAMVLVLCLFTLLAIFIPTHLDIKADPAITPVGSKPEWYFLFLFAFLHYVSPLVGTIIPVIGLAFLAFLPWLDRNPERSPLKRKIALTAAALTGIAIVALSILGALQGEGGGHG